ncbi:CAP domain-containing protein [Parasphingorhabdus sp.]|uniref:CAP domain-containing protein n=1 Tax=Parasphingorhabdus sp. TaxID=2709688 RepID=UPI003A91319D
MAPQIAYLETSFETSIIAEPVEPVITKPTPRIIVQPASRVIATPEAYTVSTLQSVMMAAHNRARTKIGAPNLVWDTQLASDAALYAGSLARSGRFGHDPQRGRKERQGENLWMGTRNAYPQTEMVGSWVDEDRYFKRGLFPENSTTGSWHDIGHYTQIIWPTTKRVGCALVNNRDYDYLVCRYSPAGNVMGQDPLRG